MFLEECNRLGLNQLGRDANRARIFKGDEATRLAHGQERGIGLIDTIDIL